MKNKITFTGIILMMAVLFLMPFSPVHAEDANDTEEEKLIDTAGVNHYHYGTKYLLISGTAGTKGKLVIDKTKYTFTIGKKQEIKVKLKKIYKAGTKYIVTLTNGSDKATINGKISKGTRLNSVTTKKKVCKVTCYNLHKGDEIKIKCKGKTFSKKINKDYDDKVPTIKLTAPIAIPAKAKLDVVITNKYKQVLLKQKIPLTNGVFANDES